MKDTLSSRSCDVTEPRSDIVQIGLGGSLRGWEYSLVACFAVVVAWNTTWIVFLEDRDAGRHPQGIWHDVSS